MSEKPAAKIRPYFSIIIIISAIFIVYFSLHYLLDLQGEQSSKLADQALGMIGRPAPHFTLPRQNQNEKPFNLVDYQGRAIVLNFWATWCPPCIAELPDLLEQAKSRKAQGFQFVAIAIDRDWQTVDEFIRNSPKLKDLKDNIIVLLDSKGIIANRYQSKRFPETFLIRDDLVIENKFVGAQPWTHKNFQPLFDKLITRK